MQEPSTRFNLPAELLKEIFKNIQEKRDIKTCLTVCKAWYFSAQGIFNDDIRIKTSDRSFKRLCSDLQTYSSLRYKTISLTLDQLSTGAEEPTMLRSIVNLCPNLTELQFEFTDVYDYFKALNCHEASLPSIKKIQVLDLNICSPAVRRFHLWVNYRFRNTITSLEIADLEDNGALKNYGGLLKLVSCFPQLTYLKAKCHSIVERELNINLTSLLQVCPKLEQLKLYGLGLISNQLKDIPGTVETTYPTLTKLKLKVAQVDIKTLQYIVARFPNVKNLRLITFNVLPDTSLTTSEAEKILDEFHSYSTLFERVNINYRYKNENFFTNHGKKRPTWSSSIMMMVGLPEGLLHEDWMEDEWLDEEDEEYLDEFADEDDLADDTNEEGIHFNHMLYEAHLASMLSAELYHQHHHHHPHLGNEDMESEEGSPDMFYEGLFDNIDHDSLDAEFIREYYSL